MTDKDRARKIEEGVHGGLGEEEILQELLAVRADERERGAKEIERDAHEGNHVTGWPAAMEWAANVVRALGRDWPKGTCMVGKVQRIEYERSLKTARQPSEAQCRTCGDPRLCGGEPSECPLESGDVEFPEDHIRPEEPRCKLDGVKP